MKLIKRCIIILISTLMLFINIRLTAYADENNKAYRAVLIGVSNTIGGDTLYGPGSDVLRLQKLLSIQKHPVETHYLLDPLKSQALNAISTVFSDADSNDVSIFYFSGHGGMKNEQAVIYMSDLSITMTELKFVLDGIAGEKIVIIDSCQSGRFIDKSFNLNIYTVNDSASTFNNSVISIFSTTELKSFNMSGYRVITAASGEQNSSDISFNTYNWRNYIMDGEDYYLNGWGGEFTNMLIMGCVPVGVDSGKNIYLPSMADFNCDKIITMNELMSYLNISMVYSKPQYYDSDPGMPLFELAENVSYPEQSIINILEIQNIKSADTINFNMPVSGNLCLKLLKNLHYENNSYRFDSSLTIQNGFVDAGKYEFYFSGINDNGTQTAQGPYALSVEIGDTWTLWYANIQDGAQPNRPPSISNLVIYSDNLQPGSVLRAVYDYFDPDGDADNTRFIWYRLSAPESMGDYVPITGADSDNYRLTRRDSGKYILLMAEAHDGKESGGFLLSDLVGPIEEGYLPGDVDNDGMLTETDAMAVLMHYSGLETLESSAFAAGDINMDGKLTSYDAFQILAKYSGLPVDW